MKYINQLFGWLWRNKGVVGVTLGSAILFFVWLFPFSDLTLMMTSMVSRATGNALYVQPESMDIHLVPTPAVSAENVSIESNFPPITAKWIKFSPSLFNLLFNIGTIRKASQGDAEASQKMLTRFGFSFAAEGLLGSDTQITYGPGSKGESGAERARTKLFVENLNLSELQAWSDLPMKMQGRAGVDAEIQFAPDFADQPEGDFTLTIEKFVLPAGTVMVPMGGASMPVNIPNLTLANVVMKGRLVGGNFIIESGQFGNQKDPIFGRIKGQMGIRFQPAGQRIVPAYGSYNFTVDLNSSRAVEKDIGIAFLLFDSAKTPTANGSRYLFRATGRNFYEPPSITRLGTF